MNAVPWPVRAVLRADDPAALAARADAHLVDAKEALADAVEAAFAGAHTSDTRRAAVLAAIRNAQVAAAHAQTMLEPIIRGRV